MAKTGKPAPKNNPAPRRETPPSAPVNWLLRPEPEQDPLFRKIFAGLAVLGLAVLVGLSLGSGINADDKFQVDYSQKLVNYYASFGADTTALNVPDGNMHLYGGFFEIVTGFANKALGFDSKELAYHQVRHVSSAVMGWAAMLCVGLFAGLIAGWRAATIAFLLMLISPRFVGDSLMNPKDIPFAAGYMMAIYNMAAVLNRIESPGRWNLTGLAIGLGIALGIRAGGLLSFAIFAMFAGLHFFMKNGGFRAFSNSALLKKYAVTTVGIAAAGYVFALIFWPYALQAPLKNPFVALSKFADLEVHIRVLYEGDNIMSDKTPWHYPLKWMLNTIPLVALAGFAGSIVMLPRLMKRYNPLWVFTALFAAVFPVFYIIYKDSVIHDGWRHLTFAYPTLCVAAALFWNELAELTSGRQATRFIVPAVLVAGSFSPASFIAMNPAMPYVYFNELAGGTKGAFGRFETDYWGVSVRQGLEWMEKEGILRPDMPETVVIATNMYYSAKQLTAKYGDKVKIKYLKWERRCDDAWDYALYPTRFIDGTTLQKGMWPPDNTVHTVMAGGAPILAVIKDNGKNCALGLAAMKINDLQGAVDRLTKEVTNVPDNELAWANLGQAYLNANMLEEAKAAAEKAIEIAPDDTQANNLIGLYWMSMNDAAKAKAQFELAIKKEPSNATAYYFLGDIYRRTGEQQKALNYLVKAIQIAPNFKPAYEMAAQIYDAAGEPDKAQQFRNAVK